MSYGVTKDVFERPRLALAKVTIDGVAAPEAANNCGVDRIDAADDDAGYTGIANHGGSVLAGMVIWGLQPGPLLFTQQPDFVWGLIGSILHCELS